MRHLLLILSIFALSPPIFAQSGIKSLKHYPSYEKVLRQFYENHAKTNDFSINLQFEKQPSGWYVIDSEIADSKWKVTRRQLFWNAKTKQFVPVKYPPSNDRSEQHLRKALDNSYLSRNFRIHPYWGYPGWQNDIIRLLRKRKKLPDHLLYGLGRAYSSKATGLLSNRAGDFSKEEDAFQLPKGNNSLSPKQLKQYLKYRLFACDKFAQLHKQNPDFKTIVGPIHTKYSNEYGTIYMDLLIYQNQQAALKHSRKKGLYDEFTMASAENYLNSVAPNAILFTHGDNDTYPLWHAQYHRGIRPDVRVLNVSILNIERFVMTLRQSIGKSAAIPLSLSEEVLDNPSLSLFYIGETEKNISLADFLAKVESQVHHSGTKPPTLPGSQLKMPTPDGNEMNWQLENNRYVLRGNLVILDIIHNSNWKRPIYFATSLRDYLGLENHLSLEGLAYRLVPKENKEEPQFSLLSHGGVNRERLSENLLKTFNFSGMDSRHADGPVSAQYNLLFLRLAEAHLLADDKKQASAVLDYWLSVMPDKYLPLGRMHSYAAKFYYQSGQPKKAEVISQQLQHNIKNGIGEFKGTDEFTERNKEDILLQLKQLTEKYR